MEHNGPLPDGEWRQRISRDTATLRRNAARVRLLALKEMPAPTNASHVAHLVDAARLEDFAETLDALTNTLYLMAQHTERHHTGEQHADTFRHAAAGTRIASEYLELARRDAARAARARKEVTQA